MMPQFSYHFSPFEHFRYEPHLFSLFETLRQLVQMLFLVSFGLFLAQEHLL